MAEFPKNDLYLGILKLVDNNHTKHSIERFKGRIRRAICKTAKSATQTYIGHKLYHIIGHEI